MSGTTLIHGHFQCRLHLGRNYVQNEDRLSPLCSSKGGAQPSKLGKAEPWEVRTKVRFTECDCLVLAKHLALVSAPNKKTNHNSRKAQ